LKSAAPESLQLSFSDQGSLELWKESCFECFLSLDGRSDYLEFNGSPEGSWNLFSFADTRKEMALIASGNSTVGGPYQFSYRIPMDLLKKYFDGVDLASQVWVVGLTAILRGIAGDESEQTFWASEHASDKPDFHNRKRWVNQLS